MEYTVRLKVFGAVAVLTAGAVGGLVASTWVASSAYRARWDSASKGERTMTATGSARIRVRSDVATWNVWVEGRNPDLKAAYAQVKAGVERVQAYLAAKGVAPADIQLSAVDTSTHFVRDADGNTTSRVENYVLKRWFTVQSKDVDRIESISGDVTALLEEGVLLGAEFPRYTVSSLAERKVDLSGRATRDARTRAETIATNAGCRLGEIRTARLGVLQVTAPNSTQTSSEGVYDTSTIDKDVTAVVSLTIVVEPQ